METIVELETGDVEVFVVGTLVDGDTLVDGKVEMLPEEETVVYEL